MVEVAVVEMDPVASTVGAANGAIVTPLRLAEMLMSLAATVVTGLPLLSFKVSFSVTGDVPLACAEAITNFILLIFYKN